MAHDFSVGLSLAGSNLHAVGSRNVASAERFRDEHGFTKAYGSYEALVGDAEVDIVYVATPHSGHYDNIMLCLNAGKSVLCEKPLCWSAVQTRHAINTAREKGIFLMEAMWTRFFPITKMARQACEEEIGDIVSLNASFGFYSQVDSLPPRMTEKALAGGALMDVGVYPVAWMVMVLGKPKTITASGKLTKGGVDEFAAIQCTFENGAVATLQCCISASLANEAVVVGTNGIVRVPSLFHCPHEFSVKTQAHPKNGFMMNGVERKVTLPHTPTTRQMNYANSQGMVHQVKEVEYALQQGWTQHPDMPWEDSIIVAEVMDEVLAQIGVHYPKEAQATHAKL